MHAFAAVVLAVAFTSAAFAGEGPAALKDLDKPAKVTAGELLALQLTAFLGSGATTETFNAPVVAAWDSKAKKVVVTVFGSKSDMEGAKASLESLSGVLRAWATLHAGGVLDDTNSVLVYYRAPGGFGGDSVLKEILRREGGKYVSP